MLLFQADIKDMEKRKRVSYIMNSDAFRAELESIVDYQLNHGPHPASVMALQNLADMLLASGGSAGSRSAPKGGGNSCFTLIIPFNHLNNSAFRFGQLL